jgi:hypothetical protein
MHVAPAQPQPFTDPKTPASCSKTTRNRSRGRRQHSSTATACSPVNASGNGVSARAFNDRARTVRNRPASPASNPGGVNRRYRGSDSRSATTCSIAPVLAAKRRNSHTAVKIALTVAPDRACPSRYGVTSSQCLNRARSAKPIVAQSIPPCRHQLRKTAVRPAYARIVCGDRPAPSRQRRKSLAWRCRTSPGSRTTHDSLPSTGDTARSALNEVIDSTMAGT